MTPTTSEREALLNGLDTMARQLEWAHDFAKRCFKDSGIEYHDDLVHSLPENPSGAVLLAWIDTLRKASAALTREQREGDDGQSAVDAVERALDYLRPHLEVGTFAAPDWAIQLASILTGGDGCGEPIKPQPEAPGAVAWNDEAAWALAKRAEAAGAERDSDDNGTWWALRIEHFNALTTPPAPVDVRALRAALEEAIRKVENDTTLWVPEWLTWKDDAQRALLDGQPAGVDEAMAARAWKAYCADNSRGGIDRMQAALRAALEGDRDGR